MSQSNEDFVENIAMYVTHTRVLLGQYDDGSRRIGRCHHQQEIHDCL
ncbi:hypothetical protein NXV13_28975 [Bacteroides ovatus]|nr:hypothetical protein [Bacteroides ovatus]